MKYIATIQGIDYEIELLEDGRVQVNDRVYQVDFSRIDAGQVFSLLVNGQSYEAYMTEEEDHLMVILEGVGYKVRVLDEHEKLLLDAGGEGTAASGVYELHAPMPGLVIKVPVVEGDNVAEGDVLVILESMKMQNELKAPRPGEVTVVNVAAGDNVEKRDVMVVLGPQPQETEG
ncbi:MAG: biotin/lipoyl-binding protein [Anaerolineales bacterium]|jgi:acetyl/propionyl-CoA carboxylase alpha subunit